jgi:hypothetical protein
MACRGFLYLGGAYAKATAEIFYFINTILFVSTKEPALML